MTELRSVNKGFKNLRLRICNGTILDYNGRSTPLRKVGIYLPNYTALHTGRQETIITVRCTASLLFWIL